jgi:hypothetical protein
MKAWSAVALLFAWSSVAAADPAQCGLKDKLVSISFGHAVTDDDAAAFLQRHHLAPNTGYLWVAGSPLTVSITEVAPAAAAASLRAAAMAARAQDRVNITAEAAVFLAHHTRGELVRDPDLAEEGKEILRRATRDDALVTRAKANKPLIWAVSVCADAATLAGIAPEEGVLVTDTPPERPEQLSARYPTPRVDLLSGAEVWAELIKLSRP